MLRLELARETSTEVVYNYFPEQSKEYGTITVSKETGDIVNAKTASNDKHSRYLHHAVAKIGKYFADKNYPNEDTVAWY